MTLPPGALVVSDPNPNVYLPQATALQSGDVYPGEMIAPERQIFDGPTVRGDIEAVITDTQNAHAVRAATVAILAAANDAGRAAISDGIAAHPLSARPITHAYTYLVDGLVQTALHIATTHLYPNAVPSATERMAVLAVGGYGRGEMAPFSDVDLLFVTPWKMTAAIEKVIEACLYMLWDLHLKVGHATRTVKDCVRLGKQDFTIRTSLLENRFLGGDPAIAHDLQNTLRAQLFKGTTAEFIEAKLAERDARHRKQGGQRYILEPNVKEGKGGLRDLQTLYWIAKYEHGVEKAQDLVNIGLLRAEEFHAFDAAEKFLWAIRCQLHLIAGRAQDQLTFDTQVMIADRFGYTDHSGRRAVEYFMQDYFRHATKVGELTRIFLTALEARHIKREPGLFDFLRGRARKHTLKDGYEVRRGRLAIRDDAVFFQDKLNILRLFEEALRTRYLIHPDAMRAVSARLDLIDDAMRQNPEANRIFIGLLLKHGNPERALRRMNELGVLAAFLPNFAPIVAMMQFNIYHKYTVDEHTIQVISTLAQIERGELVEELPIASRILEGGVNRKVLYVACLLHDIGKGQREDHSILGARIARSVCPRLGLSPAECQTVEWLVRYHLLMSDMAQKRDISDPRTVRDFAKAVKTRERLDLLTVLTVCDIRGVGPGTWNNWKATLLRGLYRATVTALETGLEALNRDKRTSEAKRALKDALADWPRAMVKTELERHYTPYWQGLDLAAQVVFARLLLRDVPNDEIRIDAQQDNDRDATRVCFALADHPGIFSRLSGALALVGANVVDARTYTSKGEYATAVFWVQDSDGNTYDDARLPRLKSMIEKTLKGEIVTSRALETGDKIKKRERPFDVPTHIAFDNDGSEIYTIIEVDTRDRPGLLYDLTKTLADANVYISSAMIATYGAQVVDTFYVKDMFGLKLYTKSRQDSLERKLRAAIAFAARRAGA